MLERVISWVNKLPAEARTLPILEHAGRYWSPNEILTQIQSCPNCSLSQALQAMLEQKLYALSPYATQTEIAKSRLIIHFTRTPGYYLTFSPEKPQISTRELAEEVAKETPLGQKLIQIEMQRMREQLEMFR
jgi:F420-0:gamma-glutamyl ligase-like protein